jgi:hypothetical protein
MRIRKFAANDLFGLEAATRFAVTAPLDLNIT